MNSKTIHMIWLGPKPMYDRYIPSVREHMPKGFTLKIWRDDEVVPLCEHCEYFRRNYNLKNWAFCTDYARFKILSEYGGLYIDTDVEFIKDFDDLIERGSFVAFEKSTGRINTGHAVYADSAHLYIYDAICNYFETYGYNWVYLADGEVITSLLENKYGFIKNNTDQVLEYNGEKIHVYKGGTFDGDKNNPESWARAIHWYTGFWNRSFSADLNNPDRILPNVN